ncbi:uncharacterized protein LJ206_003112 isoform 2-T2 [Theristicus caerulescens]
MEAFRVGPCKPSDSGEAAAFPPRRLPAHSRGALRGGGLAPPAPKPRSPPSGVGGGGGEIRLPPRGKAAAGNQNSPGLNKFLQTEDNFMPRLNYVSTRHAKSLRFFFRFIPAWAYGLRAMSTQKGSNALLALVVYFSVICLHFVYSPLLGKPKRGYRLVFSCVVRRRVITPTWFRASYKTGSSGRVCTRF